MIGKRLEFDKKFITGSSLTSVYLQSLEKFRRKCGDLVEMHIFPTSQLPCPELKSHGCTAKRFWVCPKRVGASRAHWPSELGHFRRFAPRSRPSPTPTTLLTQGAQAPFAAAGLKSPTSVGQNSVTSLQPKQDAPKGFSTWRHGGRREKLRGSRRKFSPDLIFFLRAFVSLCLRGLFSGKPSPMIIDMPHATHAFSIPFGVAGKINQKRAP